MRIDVQEIVIDCNDVTAVATFWSQLLDRPWAMVYNPDWAALDLGCVRLCFQEVPEPKQSPKNRMHLDLLVDHLSEAADRAEQLGATVQQRSIDDEAGTGCVVMLDVEGNEFCLTRDADGTYEADVAKALGS